ncbi:cyanophycinase [Stenomitos frigidus]|uniref:Cyanophycinase n=1 Tax=Stenomitos frigidus ULC18 TaxID=2107698 RepID=A0A2T1E9Y8_9CYAN|nr:cyanophycinase [Stenomitos frigidus]PSB29524.1 cyanophycinase [Stenomitos frigidus ULC18]
MNSIQKRGKLVIIGGAEDKEGDCLILREFVRCAGGSKARIVVFTAASSDPQAVGENYVRVFKRIGVEDVQVLHTRDRDDVDSHQGLDFVKQATGVFFTGGNQARIVDIIKGTKLDTLIHDRYAEGLVVGGTSAGAAMMPDKMIVEGEGETEPTLKVAEMDDGLGFLSKVVIDQHFAQRGRLGRLLSALIQDPSFLGFGIDEDTAIVVSGDELKVVGSGSVTVLMESESGYNNLSDLREDESMAIFDVKLHILPHGYRFNLKALKPLRPETQVERGKAKLDGHERSIVPPEMSGRPL